MTENYHQTLTPARQAKLRRIRHPALDMDGTIYMDEIAMVGDRIYTDIAMGHNAGAVSVLVLSGETNLDTALRVAEDARDNPQPEFHPADFIVRDIRELGELILQCRQ